MHKSRNGVETCTKNASRSLVVSHKTANDKINDEAVSNKHHRYFCYQPTCRACDFRPTRREPLKQRGSLAIYGPCEVQIRS
jgi:hypothetical protein